MEDSECHHLHELMPLMLSTKSGLGMQEQREFSGAAAAPELVPPVPECIWSRDSRQNLPKTIVSLHFVAERI